MKTFKSMAAQGDMLIRKVKAIPKEVEQVTEKGPVVLAHSETSHNHQFDDPAGLTLFKTQDPFISFLRVEQPAVLLHKREFDTHEEILFDAGDYEIRRQREWTPEGMRRVED